MARAPQNAQASAVPAQERAGKLDWGNLRFFLELARSGSLSRAAQRLSVDRNTVARRVAALEEELGLALFERGPQGWTRTPAGDELAALASQIEEDVLALARHVDASDHALAGTVRLTTATHLSAHLLVPALPALRERHPGILLEIAADQRTFDLSRREADLALRMGRPRDARARHAQAVRRRVRPLRRAATRPRRGAAPSTSLAIRSSPSTPRSRAHRRSAGSRASPRSAGSCSGATAPPRCTRRLGSGWGSRCCPASSRRTTRRSTRLDGPEPVHARALAARAWRPAPHAAGARGHRVGRRAGRVGAPLRSAGAEPGPYFAPSSAFTFSITANASATYSTSALPRAHPQPASRFTARRSRMNRQPTTCGSSPWQQVASPFGWRGVAPVWPTWFRWRHELEDPLSLPRLIDE